MAARHASTPDPRARELFDAALDRPVPERAAFLQAACGGDLALQARVEGLLGAYERAEAMNFLGQPTADDVASAGSGGEGTGSRIGPYHLVELLGEGGFGRVYRATQSEPMARTVAVKVLKPGMDSRQVIARFEAEARALARMDHPGIARILDAGTTASGRPFFVLQYVDGQPVTAYCDRRGLEVRDRLEIFERICLAVHHAHQKGVIHRDLKPSNLLVAERDEVPLAKVIDFGIAKALAEPLTERTLHTGVRQLLGTPQYMSPEQARVGEADVDTRSDIYSLGVVLYELLTGVTPFEEALRTQDPAEIQRILREEQPARPSVRVAVGVSEREERAHRRRSDVRGLAKLLRGDLDWIVLRALAKDPGRRYDSAAGLARDIRRYLDHEPVLARRPGTGYLLWKFVQRHQVAATTVVAIGTALVIGLVLAMIGLQEASQQRDLAQAQLRDTYLARARASRAGDLPGRRTDSLEALRQAAALRGGDDLRDEAIACMTLTDVTLKREVPLPPTLFGHGSGWHGLVASWSEPGQLQVIDAGRGVVRTTLPGPREAPTWGEVSRCGRLLALGFPDRRLEVWDVVTQRRGLSRPLGAGSREAVAFDRGASPPRWLAVTAGAHEVRVLDLPAGSKRLELRAPGGRVVLASSPDGEQLAVSGDGRPREVVVFALRDGIRVAHFPIASGLNALDWSPDGRQLAGAADDTNVYVWSLESGSVLRTFRGHQASAVEVSFGPRGDVLASYGWDHTVRLWDVPLDRPLIGPLRGHTFIALGEELLTARRGNVDTFALERAPELRRGRAGDSFGAPARLAVAADGRWLATAGSNGVRLWDAATMQQTAVATTDAARSVHLVDSDRTLLALAGDALLSWSVSGGPERPELGEPVVLAGFRAARASTVAPDGRQVIVVDRDGVHWLDVATRRIVRQLPPYGGMATTPSVSPDGRWLFTGTWKGEPARVWEIGRGTVVVQYSGSHVVGSFSRDGRWLCVGDGATHRFVTTGSWDPVRTMKRDNYDDLAGTVAFTADGTLVAMAHSRYVIQLVEPGSGRVLASLENPDGVATSDLAFDASGDLLGVVTPARDLQVWDLRRIRAGLRAMDLGWAEQRTRRH